jgi:hypothetical protein
MSHIGLTHWVDVVQTEHENTIFSEMWQFTYDIDFWKNS